MKYLLLCALMAVASAAHADNEPVPPQTRFNALPAGAKFLVHQQINMMLGDGNSYRKSFGGGASIWTTSAAHKTLEPGQTLEIQSIEEPIPSRGRPMYANTPGRVLQIDRFDYDKIKTVEDFNRKFDGLLSVVWNDPEADPFPGVPEEVKQDLLMTRILAAIKADKHVDALPDFARLEKMGRKQPESFYYYYVVALDKAGRTVPAKERGTAFLKTYGKASKYYNDVLAIMAK